jgi:hypothetical protein
VEHSITLCHVLETQSEEVKHPEPAEVAGTQAVAAEIATSSTSNIENPGVSVSAAGQCERVTLFKKVHARTGIQKWATNHKFSRTGVFDWMAAGCQPSKGKVSPEKSDEFWKAVLEDAKEPGLLARTDSD